MVKSTAKKSKGEKSNGEKSTLSYLHKVFNQSLKDGVVTTYEEIIIDGPKGITLKFYNKDNKKEEKITIFGNGNNFKMTTKIGDDKKEEELTKDQLLDVLKKNKNLKFASEFVKTQKGGEWLNVARPKSKSSSKKSSSSKKASSSKKTKTKSKSNKKSSTSKKVKRV